MSLLTNPNFKIVFEDVELHICCVRIAPAVINAHADVLLCGKAAQYPLKRTDVISSSVSNGQLNTCQGNLFLGQLP